MNLQPGSIVTIRNLVTRQTALFTVSHLVEYDGCNIVCGVTQQHGIRVAKGPMTVKSRPGFFVWLPNESAPKIVKLSQELRGLPLALVDRSEIGDVGSMTTVSGVARAYPIFNSGRLPALGPESPREVPAQVERGKKLVDIYHYWKEHGSLPAWASLTMPSMN